MLQPFVRAPGMLEYHWSSIRMAKQVLVEKPIVRHSSIRSRTRFAEDPQIDSGIRENDSSCFSASGPTYRM